MQQPVTALCPSCNKVNMVPALDPFAGTGFPLTACPWCKKDVLVLAFPAGRRREAAGGAGVKAVDGDSVCFHHQGKRAEVACDVCGRFLCGLCHIDWDGRAVCSACFTQEHTHGNKSAVTRNATSAHVPRRVRYDKIALACAVFAPMVHIFSVIPAGVALFLCFRHWKTPISVIPRNRWRFVAAGIIAAAVLAGTVLLVVSMVMAVSTFNTMKNEKQPAPRQEEVTHDDE